MKFIDRCKAGEFKNKPQFDREAYLKERHKKELEKPLISKREASGITDEYIKEHKLPF